ncbi:hypothetical protein JZ751_022266 [Albula glossodonta]|uniref:TIR domain-containing protein n=1 Tax=Albula glossodonta TaxID=121402 RepID=A0A8T2NLN8_9TELE|nr:hypothetical protein JZ751_022266 [Albula glossodonta]
MHMSVSIISRIRKVLQIRTSQARNMAVQNDNQDKGIEQCLSFTQPKSDLSNRNLTKVPPNLPNDTLYLDLSHNNISRLNSGDLADLLQLCFLKLTHNGLRKTQDMKALESLDLSFNSITSSGGTCSWPVHLTELNLSNNNLGTMAFHCLSSYFQNINLSKTGITSVSGEVLSNFPSLRHLYLSANNIHVSSRLREASFRYHAFISYSHHDSLWVDSLLFPSLEGAGLSLCVHERDFTPGDWVLNNIINCVEESYKTLFVLSQSFIQSEWCNYELFFAQHRALSVHQDSLVFVLLEPIPSDSIPRKFLKLRSLLRLQTYLEWPKDERKQQVFWASLRDMLRTADKSMVLKKVAIDITDTCPLLEEADTKPF